MDFLKRSIKFNSLFVLEAAGSFILDLVVAALFGLGLSSDALYAAWLLPQTIGRGMFQSLTNSFMGLFVDTGDRNQDYSQAITVVAIVAFPIAAGFSITSSLWLPLTIPGSSGEVQSLAISLATILSWLVCFLALAETTRAIYYQEDRLGIPSLARLLGNAVAIVSIVISGLRTDLLIAALGITLGAAIEAGVQFFALQPVLNVRFRPSWPNAERLREIRKLTLIPLAGVGIRMIASAIERALASLLFPGAITVVAYADRIISTLDRFVFRGFVVSTINMYRNKKTLDLQANFRLVTLLALPIVILLTLLPEQLVSVVFQRGRFTMQDVEALAIVLQMYAPAVLGIALTRIPFGLAYARQQSQVIFGFFAVASLVLVISESLFIWLGLGLRSFGLAYTLAIAASFVWLYRPVWLFRQEHLLEKHDGLRLASLGLIVFFGTALTVMLTDTYLGTLPRSDWFTLIAGVVSCGISFVGGAYLLQLEEFRELFSIILRSPK